MSLLVGRVVTEHDPNRADDCTSTRLQNMSSEWIGKWFLRVPISFIYAHKQIPIHLTKLIGISEGLP